MATARSSKRARKAPSVFEPTLEAASRTAGDFAQAASCKAAEDSAAPTVAKKNPLGATTSTGNASNQTHGQLQVLCELHGLPKQGKSTDLKRRIVEHLHFNQPGFVAGDHVRAVFPDGNLYAATVVSVTREGDYIVDWADGDDQHRLRARHEVLSAEGDGACEAELPAPVAPKKVAKRKVGPGCVQRRVRKPSQLVDGPKQNVGRDGRKAVALGELQLNVNDPPPPVLAPVQAAKVTEHTAKPRTACASSSYAMKHIVLEGEVLGDGFYDPGRLQGRRLLSLAEIGDTPRSEGREVIVVDSRRDPQLANLRDRVVAAVKLADTVKHTPWTHLACVLRAPTLIGLVSDAGSSRCAHRIASGCQPSRRLNRVSSYAPPTYTTHTLRTPRTCTY